MCVKVTKVNQGHPKLLLVQRLHRPTKLRNMKSMSTSRRCSGSRHIAKLPKVRNIRGWFCMPISRKR